MKEQRFYFNGLFYDNEEQFRAATSHWANSEISPVSAERILEHMCKDISLNLSNPFGDEKLIANAELSEMCLRLTAELIAEFREKLQKMRKDDN